MQERETLPSGIQKHLAEHVALYKRDPERAHWWDSSVIGIPGPVRTLLLSTTGRKSGEERYVTLQYFTPGDKYVVVGSKGGVAAHPAWYLNLLETRRCHIQVGAFSSWVEAHVASGVEYTALWEHVSREQPQYKKYQAKTARQIPIVILELTGNESAS